MIFSVCSESILCNTKSGTWAPVGYTQIPMIPPTWAHLAPVGQPPRMHVRAQYLFPLWSWRMHWGLSLVPGGTSVGQLPDASHFGAQTWPPAPWTEASVSSL